MVELISELPTDQIPPTQDEKDMISWLYTDPTQNVQQTTKKLVLEFQTTLWIGVLFLLFSLPQIDGVIHSFVSFTTGQKYITLVIKTLLFMITTWILLNFTYMKK